MRPEMAVTRRQMLRCGAALAAAGSAHGGAWADTILGTATAPSDRVTVGIIGVGAAGRAHLDALRAMKDAEVLAVADVYEKRGTESLAGMGGGVAGYRDYRELLRRTDIDAVVIATPDHWHARIAVDACEAGKDVYCERPLALTIREGRAVVRSARRNGTVFQVGSRGRSEASWRRACELVRSGRIGRVQWVRTGLGGGPTGSGERAETPPAGLDWDFWLGPAPWAEFHPKRCFDTFRWFYDYGGGTMTDAGADQSDIAQWALGMDGGGPVRSEPISARFPTEGLFEAATAFEVKHTYGNGVVLYASSEAGGIHFQGSDGWIKVDGANLATSAPNLSAEPLGARDVRLYNSPDHRRDWLDCIRTRRRPVCDVEIGCRAATICHLGNIAIRTGKTIQWDPGIEMITNDETLNRWLSTPYRTPWKSPALV